VASRLRFVTTRLHSSWVCVSVSEVLDQGFYLSLKFHYNVAICISKTRKHTEISNDKDNFSAQLQLTWILSKV
jgi:hypothetical protein